MDKSDIQRTHRLWQMLRKLVKYGITALTVLCTIHSILLSIGYDFFSVHLLLCSFLYVLGLCLSRLFNYAGYTKHALSTLAQLYCL